jgi:hypothetical protein
MRLIGRSNANHIGASNPILQFNELDLVPDLPQPSQRWTVQRKSTVIQAVRGGWVPVEEVCELYNISVDELLAWERDLDRYGVHGLRTTRVQIYRETDKERPRTA